MAQRVTTTGRWRIRWSGWLLLALLVLPMAEIAVILAVGRAIGGWPTVGLLIVESALGAWVVRREGSRAWTALATALRSGRMPSRELTDAALVLVGGTLLLTPGFVTDIAGFFCVLPFTRALARPVLAAVVQRRLLGAVVGGTAYGSADGAGAPGSPGSAATGPHPRRGATGTAGTVIPGEVVDRSSGTHKR